MATVTQRPPANLSESSRKVHDPLGRLRGYIRTYVITESLSSLLLCLAICFWVGLLCDYGSFLLGVDWARDLPRWLRASLLVIGLCTVVFVVELRKSFQRHDAHKAAAAGVRRQSQFDFFAIAQTGLLALFAILFIGFAIRRDLADNVLLAAGENLSVSEGIFCAAIVLGLLVVFTLLIIARRMMYEFSDPALALVLEKRFPGILGDRLITAVELADTKKAAKYGYSEAMIVQTIHDAARCVDRLNIHEVFDWNRLYLRTGLAAALTLGIYGVAFGSLAGIGAMTKKDAGSQFTALNDAAAIWTERNVFLHNERWPTRSIVQLEDFPYSGELKKGKGSEGGKDLTRVDLKAKALEYVFHDSREQECWRPLLLSDLTGDRAVPSLDILERLPFEGAKNGWTADHLKFMSQHEPMLKLINAATQAGLKALLEEIDELAEKPSMSRTLRKLIVPSEVIIRYRTEDGMTKAAATMQTQANNRYSAELSLKDSVVFHLTAEDYVSDSRKITLVPPPRVSKLLSIEERPAYLYHLYETEGRILPSVMASTTALLTAPGNPLVAASALPPERPYDDDRYFLGPRKQRGKPIAVNVGGELKPKIPVPATTNVVLQAETDKDLEPGTVRLDARGALALANIKPRETGTRTFEIVIPNVRAELDFRLEFTDTDGAIGMQELQIVIDEDSPPSVDQFKPEVVREVGGKFKVTPQAVIPFTFFVKDPKFGLADLDFVYTIKEAPTPGEQARRAMRVAGGAGLILSGPEAPLSSYFYNLVMPTTLRGSEEVLEGRLPVAEFKARMENHRRFRDFILNNTKTIPRRWSDTEKELAEEISFTAPAKMLLSYNLPELRDLDKYLTDHDLRIDECFPLKGMDLSLIRRVDSTGLLAPLKARPLEIQRRYDMTVSLEARDTNVSRPLRGRHESQPIAFEIVSEIELLFEMNQEEQRLYDELNKASADLKRGFGQLQALRFDMAASPPPGRSISFDSFSVRTEDVQKIANESKRMTAKVTSDYEKVLREMRTNRIENSDAVRKTKNEIVIPLNKILVGDYQVKEAGMDVRVGFPVAADGLNFLRKAVDNASSNDADRLALARREAEGAEKDLDRLSKALDAVLLEMKGIVELGEILKGLRDIELKQLESLRKIEEKKRIEEENLFKGLGK